MCRSDRDADAYDEIRDDALTENDNALVQHTPGPWRKKPDSCEIVSETRPICLVHTYGTDDKNWLVNAALIARAPEFAARIRELEAQLAAATERERGRVELLRRLEWIEGEYGPRTCYCCYMQEPRSHTEVCPIAAALAAAQPKEGTK